MARLRKYHDSWRASGKWLKYQFPRLTERVRGSKSKKNTTKWCKGKVGVLHDYELVFPKNESRTIRGWRRTPTCKNCQKQDYKNTVYLNKKTGQYESHFDLWGDTND